jgi:hypothetical protein
VQSPAAALTGPHFDYSTRTETRATGFSIAKKLGKERHAIVTG